MNSDKMLHVTSSNGRNVYITLLFRYTVNTFITVAASDTMWGVDVVKCLLERQLHTIVRRAHRRFAEQLYHWRAQLKHVHGTCLFCLWDL